MNTNPLSTVTCRPALAKDYDDVLELTKNIWEGHDYVPSVWKRWLADPKGFLASAEYGGQVIGVGKLDLISPGDWWLMGLRVHPDYQGHKVGSRLHDYLVGWWQEHGGGTIRLCTMDDRYPVHHMCARTGFYKLMEIGWFTHPAEPDPVAASHFRLVSPEQADRALETLTSSEMLPFYHGLLDMSWTWSRPHLSIIEEYLNEQKLWWWQPHGWQSPGGTEGLLGGYDDEDDDGESFFMMNMPSCKREHFPALIKDTVALAASKGFQSIQIVSPIDPDPLPEVTAAGFTRAWDHSMYVFEKSLRP
jgi:GNAT superfamily N-acetyltransferase